MPKPRTPLKILKNKGTYQKCRHDGRDDLELPEGIPDKPEYLNPIAAAEWDRVVKDLSFHGILSELDGPAVAIYCELYAEFQNTRSCPSNFPASKFSQLRQALSDLGMSPIARTKIPKSKQDPKKKNPFQSPPTGNKKGKTA